MNTKLFKTHLLRAVIDNEIHDKLHSLLMDGIQYLFPVLKRPIPRVDISVVRDVVSHIGLRRLV